jgi:hypothetical protein
MKTSLQVILAVAAITVLASPVMAQSAGILAVSPEDWRQAAASAQHVMISLENIARAHARARLSQQRMSVYARQGH